VENFVFIAKKIAEKLSMDPSEVIEIRWFDIKNIPRELLITHKKRINNFKKGIRGTVMEEKFKWPFDKNITRKKLYEMRDKSGLSRKDFYEKYFGF
jgi:hypothetical protein